MYLQMHECVLSLSTYVNKRMQSHICVHVIVYLASSLFTYSLFGLVVYSSIHVWFHQ